MKRFKRFLHTLFPKLCSASYRWNNDWLECDCGQKIGFKYFVPDYDLTYDVNEETIICKDKESEERMFYVYPYGKYIKLKESN